MRYLYQPESARLGTESQRHGLRAGTRNRYGTHHGRPPRRRSARRPSRHSRCGRYPAGGAPRAGRDPRPEFKTAEFKEGVEKVADLAPGTYLVLVNSTDGLSMAKRIVVQ